jgi:hypothetical protein
VRSFAPLRLGRRWSDPLSWALAIVALALLGVAVISRPLSGTSITPAMAFVAIGVLAGPLVLDDITVAPRGVTVRTLAEATLALFAVIVQDSQLAHTATIVATTYTAVGLSVLVHGLSAAPSVNRYVRWHQAHPSGGDSSMESSGAQAPRARTSTPRGSRPAAGCLSGLGVRTMQWVASRPVVPGQYGRHL